MEYDFYLKEKKSGTPVIQLEINNELLNFECDTGATNSFLNKSSVVLNMKLFTKEPEVLINLKRVRGLDLTSSDINSVKNFVITNYDLLMDLSNEKIDFITFTELMK